MFHYDQLRFITSHYFLLKWSLVMFTPITLHVKYMKIIFIVDMIDSPLSYSILSILL